MLALAVFIVIIVWQAEMDVLKKTEADLTKGKDKLEKMVKDLEQEKVSAIDVSVWGGWGTSVYFTLSTQLGGRIFLTPSRQVWEGVYWLTGGLGRSVLADRRSG